MDLSLNNLFLVVYVLIYLWDTLFIGDIFLKSFKLNCNNIIEKRVYQFALGNLVFSFAFHYLGIFHLLYGQLILLLYIGPLVFLTKHLLAAHLEFNLAEQIGKYLKRKWKPSELLIGFFLVITLGPLIPHLFSFPTSWDALAYHLVLPKVFLRDHFFSFYGWLPNTLNPVGIESLFSLGEIVGDPRLSNFINFSFLGFLVAYVVYGLRYLFPRKLLLTALFLFLFRQILFSQVSVTPFVDFPLSLYTLLIATTLLKYLKTNKWQDLLLTLIFGLFTFLVKYAVGLVVILALLLVLIVHFLFNGRILKKMLQGMNGVHKFTFVGCFIAFLMPVVFWLTRNYIYTADPIYPFLASFWNQFHPVWNYNPMDYQSQMTETRSGMIYLDTLLALKNGLHVTLPPLHEILSSAVLIIFSLMGLFSKDRGIRYLSGFGLFSAFLVYSIVGFPAYRYNLAIASVLSLTTAHVFFNFFKKRFLWLKLPLVVLFVVTLFIQMMTSLKYGADFYLVNFKPVLKGMLSYKVAVRNMFAQDNFRNIDYVNKHLDKNKDKILVMFDNRLYYFNIPAEFSVQSKASVFANPKTKDAGEISNKLKKEGITYIFINNNWGYFASLRKDLYESFINSYLEPVSTASGTVVYKLK